MKTKNVRVRLKDIKQGVRVFVAHPEYGIREMEITSRPYLCTTKIGTTLGWWVDYLRVGLGGAVIRDSASLHDAGVPPGESYNYRRTFFKRKHAEGWMRKMKTDPGFIEYLRKHKAFTDLWCPYED